MNEAYRLSKNYSLLTVIQLLNFLLPLIAIPFAVRIMGPARFGLINYLLAVQLWLIVIINYGFDYSATRVATQDKIDAGRQYFWQVLYARIFLFVICSLVFSILFYCLPPLRADLRITFWTFAAIISFVITPNWFYQANQNLPKATIFTVIGKLFFCISVIYFIHQPADYWRYAAYSAITQIIAAIALLLYTIKKYQLYPSKIYIGEIKNILVKGRHIFIITILLSATSTINTLLLEYLQNTTTVGYFTAATRIITVVQTLLLLPLTQTLFPFLNKQYDIDNKQSNQHLFQKYFPLIFYIGIGCSVTTFLLAPIAIKILYGRAFDQSIALLRILSVMPFLFILNNYLGMQIGLIAQLDRKIAIAIALSIVGNILFNCIAAPMLGARGTAIAWICSELLLLVLLSLILHRERMQPFSKNIVRPDQIKLLVKELIVK